MVEIKLSFYFDQKRDNVNAIYICIYIQLQYMLPHKLK